MACLPSAASTRARPAPGERTTIRCSSSRGSTTASTGPSATAETRRVGRCVRMAISPTKPPSSTHPTSSMLAAAQPSGARAPISTPGAASSRTRPAATKSASPASSPCRVRNDPSRNARRSMATSSGSSGRSSRARRQFMARERRSARDTPRAACHAAILASAARRIRDPRAASWLMALSSRASGTAYASTLVLAKVLDRRRGSPAMMASSPRSSPCPTSAITSWGCAAGPPAPAPPFLSTITCAMPLQI
mmetsp:Transcript_47086/g.150936  ORF Transcript_47086/g.150936 Transcript_47086/m.150936 type:complete len:250 (-) Transcript_47086:300-1049(-)